VATYEDFDRTVWAARRRATTPPTETQDRAPDDGEAKLPVGAVPAGEVSAADLVEVYGPLAQLVADRAGATSPYVVAVTGSVAVGKSAAARALAQAFADDTERAPVAVVCTDGFLHPNRELAARGLMARKGFPESFDLEALTEFLVAVRAGEARVRAPVYSHTTYDIVEGASQVVDRPSVLVLEGLPFPDEHVDFTVYLDAETDDIEAWYVARFEALRVAAADDETSFFRWIADASPDEAAAYARSVWAAVNLVNLEEHVLPARDASDVILVKGADHAVRRVRLRVA
jgi:type I pantothenate kinase